MSVQWEYLVEGVMEMAHTEQDGVLRSTFETNLNLLGKDGWELVGLTPLSDWALFKRPVTVTNAAIEGKMYTP